MATNAPLTRSAAANASASGRSLGCENQLELQDILGGGNSNISLFSPRPGEMIQFDSYFSDGLKPPTRYLSAVFVFPGGETHGTVS